MTGPPHTGDGPGAGRGARRADDGAGAFSGPALAPVARGGIVSFGGAAVSAVLGFVLTIVVARGLGADGAGLFFEAVAVFTIVTTVAVFGADTATVRFVPRYLVLGRSADLRRMLLQASVVVVVLAVTGAGLVYGYAGPLARLVAGDQAAAFARDLRDLAPWVPLGAVFFLHAQASRGFGSVVPFVALQNVLLPVGRPLATAIVIAAGMGSSVVLQAWALPLLPAAVAAAVVVWRGCIRAATPGAHHAVAGWRPIAADFWGFAAARGVAATLTIALTWFDVLLVGSLASPRDAGVYAAASRFITAGTLAMQALRLVVAPHVSALLSRGAKQQAGELHRTATVWITLASWPLYLTFATFGTFLLGLFGPGFTGAGTALAILAVASLVNLATGNVQTVLLMAGRSSWNMADVAVALLLNVVLNVALVPHFGIVGAAIAWAVSIVVENVLAAAQVRWGMGIRTFSLPLGKAMAASAVCFGLFGAAVRALTGPTASGFALFLTVALAGFGCYVWRSRRAFRIDDLLAAAPRPGRVRLNRTPVRAPAGSRE